jgi:hypothetical protein
VADVEPIKGYTKPMMDILKKQQMIVEQQLTPTSATYHKRSREGLRNVIKATQKNITYRTEVTNKRKKKSSPKRKSGGARKNTKIVVEQVVENEQENEEHDEENVEAPIDEEEKVEEAPPKAGATRKIKKRRGRKPGIKNKRNIVAPKQATPPQSIVEESSEDIHDKNASSSNDSESLQTKRKRGRPKLHKQSETIESIAETEEDSFYFDIPGEGSNDFARDLSDLEVASNVSAVEDENSNHGTVSSVSEIVPKRRRGRYYNDDDFEADTDEASNISSVSYVSKSSKSSKSSFKPRRMRAQISNDSGIVTRNKIKSRSTSRSVAATENDDISEENEDEEEEEDVSEFEANSGDESEDQAMEFDDDEGDEEMSEDQDDIDSECDDDDDDDDSIDIKYSPIKTRHARRKINCFNMKQIRGN